MSAATRHLWHLAAISIAMMALGMIWAMFETRLFQGDLVWVKPFKFALSIAVFFATLAAAAQTLSPAQQKRWTLKAATLAMAAAFWVEMIYITLQAAKGEASHFNQSSALHGLLYGLMGLGAFTLVMGAAVIGWAVLRDTAGRLGANMRLGVGLGFILSTVLTLITAFTLGGNGGHFVGTPPAGAATIPFFGWSGAVGDLRPSHFAALHAMQAIPVLAWWARSRANARVWIWGGAAVYSLVTLALFAQALMGLPLIRL